MGFSTRGVMAKILSWHFHHLNIVGFLLKRRPTKGGSRAPQDPPPYAPAMVCLGTASEWLKEIFLTQPPQNHYHIISMEFLQSFLKWQFARCAKCSVLSWARHLAAVIHNWFSHLRHKAWLEVDQRFLEFYFPLLPLQSFVVFCLQAKAKPKFCLQGPTNAKSCRQNFLC